ncbi:VacB/RNase II family 3'-5' exoribonuclease [Nitratifractor sp.]
MSPFAIQLTRGFLPHELEEEDYALFEILEGLGAVKEGTDGLWRLGSLYRVGRLWISKDGRGYVEAERKEEKDLLIEPSDLEGAKNGDEVVVKRIIARRGRPSARVILVTRPAEVVIIGYTDRDEESHFLVRHIRTGEATEARMPGMDLKAFKLGTVLLIDAATSWVREVLGHLGDPRVDERISLLLYDRQGEDFPPDCVEQAKAIPAEVLPEEIATRRDLRALPFCTIDPVTAKDFDDAIYFDRATHTLYVAIADVSHYVGYFSPIDKEAKVRGFTTYLPHKAFPMLPRELSENICSLKPHVDRLAFVCRILLDPETLEPLEEEFFEGVIHSKRRWNYDEIDAILEGKRTHFSDTEERILDWLLPLQKLTERLRKRRLKKGFDFRTDEVKLAIDHEHELKETTIKTGTPSHSLIEECMLLANKAAAKRFTGDGDAIFRIHEAPDRAKMDELLETLATVGIFVDVGEEAQSPTIIRMIQEEAQRMGLRNEVDALIIQSLRRASYSPFNVGHFGLGFERYSHFTSPIRRYSDLILHRLIKADLQKDDERKGYLLRNIEPLCARVSELERNATKAEWDFRDRKFARWARRRLGERFPAQIVEIDLEDIGRGARAVLECEMEGIVVELPTFDALLFDRIEVELVESDIARAVITARQVGKRDN